MCSAHDHSYQLKTETTFVDTVLVTNVSHEFGICGRLLRVGKNGGRI